MLFRDFFRAQKYMRTLPPPLNIYENLHTLVHLCNALYLNVLVRGMALLKKLQRPTLWIYLSLNWHIRPHADPSAIIFVKESC